jgi:hypothetical protein
VERPGGLLAKNNDAFALHRLVVLDTSRNNVEKNDNMTLESSPAALPMLDNYMKNGDDNARIQARGWFVHLSDQNFAPRSKFALRLNALSVTFKCLERIMLIQQL